VEKEKKRRKLWRFFYWV